MGTRRNARERALQILFQLEFDETPPDLIFRQYWQDKKVSEEERRHCEGLVEGIAAHKPRIDAIIQSVSVNWRVSRMVLVDRNILRIAAYELFWGERLAPGIVINEAIEIAKKYSGEQSAAFINGILDALHRRSDEILKAMKEEGNE
jgi:N utilization substance protein B